MDEKKGENLNLTITFKHKPFFIFFVTWHPRLGTPRNADVIYVMSQGGVVQKGRFDELMAQEGLFRQLVTRQLA